MSEIKNAHSHRHITKYLLVFLALMVLTGLTVGVSYLHLGIAGAVGLALIVALTKGSLVMAYFMHLIGEHKSIMWVLLITLIFFLMLLLVPTLVIVTDYQVN